MVSPDKFQQAFIDHKVEKNQAVRLRAVAGSGKTTTSVLKIKSLIDSGQFNPEQIVFITFSNKSARDLNHKYYKLTGYQERPVMSTCHSFALNIIKNYFDKKPSLLNEWSSILVMRDVMEELKLDETYQLTTKRELTAIARATVDATHWYKSNVFTVEENLHEKLKDSNFNYRDFDYPDIPVTPEEFIKCFQLYEEYKHNANQVDYSDLIYKLLAKLRNDETLKSTLKEKYPVFFLDEAQDCDQLLFHFIYELTSGNNLFTIYDSAQTIYSFRWAAPFMLEENILSTRFESVATYSLEFNYRSTANIVNLGNRIRRIIGEDVMAQPFKEEAKGSVRVITTRTNKGEGVQAAKLIKEYQEKGYNLSDIVILGRTNNYLKTIVEPVLTQNEIPYRLTTKNRKKLFDKPIVHAYFNLFSLINNPDNLFTLIELSNHVKGIGDQFRAKIKRQTYTNKNTNLTPSESNKMTILENLKSEIETIKDITKPSKLSSVLLGFEEIIRKYFKETFTTAKELELINKTVSTIVFNYYDDMGIRDLHEIFDKLLLDFTEIDTSNVKDSVTLMTTHGSKGLEFPIVITGDQAKAIEHDDEDEYSEGCILYVQLSRAIDHLILFHSKEYVDYAMRSREAKHTKPYAKLKHELGV